MPGARKALEEFHRMRVPTAVVSNTSFGERVIRYELDKHGLSEHLAFVMVSSDYAVRKPNVLLFETAAARLGVQPEDIWFMGDRLDTDIAGARAAGMAAVWFNPHQEQGASQAVDLTVDHWDALVRHVRGASPALA
jgi:putative hydrolase of the HAD superfamily